MSDSQFDLKYINEAPLQSWDTVSDDLLDMDVAMFLRKQSSTGVHSITFMRDFSSLVERHKHERMPCWNAQFLRQTKLPLYTTSTAFTTRHRSKVLNDPTEYEQMFHLTFGSTSKHGNTEIVSPFMMNRFAQFARDQARNVLTSLSLSTTIQTMKHSVCIKEEEATSHINNVTMSVLDKTFAETFHENLKPGEKLHRELCALYGSVTSHSMSNLQQFVDCIQDLAQVSVYSSQLVDAVFQTVDLRNIAEVGILFSTSVYKIADFIAAEINTFILNTVTVGYFSDDGQMLEATNKVLTSVCCDIVRSVIEKKITEAFMLDSREMTMGLYSSIYDKLSNMTKYKRPISFSSRSSKTDSLSQSSKTCSNYSKVSEEMTLRLKEHYKDMMKTRGRHIMQSMTEAAARVLIKNLQINIIILDVDQEVIIKFSSQDSLETIQLVYNPPCCVFRGGHYDVYKDGKVVPVACKRTEDETEDNNLLYSAIATAMGHPFNHCETNIENPHIFDRHFGETLATEHYARQLKRGRALLRLGMNRSTTEIEPSKEVQHDSSHLLSCIEQALKSENASQLAKVLAQYELESRSAEDISSGSKTEAHVSRDACQVFLTSGGSVEAEVYR